MKKWLMWFTVIVILFAVAIFSEEKIDQNALKVNYYDLIVAAGELFNNHSQSEGQYYNRSFQSEREVAKLLDGKVTGSGMQLVVDSIFEEYDDLYVYKQQYQDYLTDTLDFKLSHNRSNYYEAVKNTILNPALRLLPFELFEVIQIENKVVVIAEEIRVDFYDDGDWQSEHHQYARYGFPPSDYISMTLTFVKKDSQYLLDDFKITSHGM